MVLKPRTITHVCFILIQWFRKVKSFLRHTDGFPLQQIIHLGVTPLCLLLTVFIISDGDGDDVVSSHHGSAPVVAQRRAEMHLEFLLGLINGVVVDMDRAVFHLENHGNKSETLNRHRLPSSGCRWACHLLSFEESDARLVRVPPLLEVVHHHGGHGSSEAPHRGPEGQVSGPDDGDVEDAVPLLHRVGAPLKLHAGN